MVCELVLIALYMQLRNPAVFKMPYAATEAASYCQALRKNPTWRCVDYEQGVSVAYGAGHQIRPLALAK
jgi:uncharacterized protein